MSYEENLHKSLEQYWVGKEKIDFMDIGLKQQLHQTLGHIFEACKVEKDKKIVSYILSGIFYLYDWNTNILSWNHWNQYWELVLEENIVWPNWENHRFFSNMLKK